MRAGMSLLWDNPLGAELPSLVVVVGHGLPSHLIFELNYYYYYMAILLSPGLCGGQRECFVSAGEFWGHFAVSPSSD